MEILYVILSIISLCATFILNDIGSQFKWLTLSFGITMGICSFIFKNKVKDEVEDNNLNTTKEGNKNDI